MRQFVGAVALSLCLAGVGVNAEAQSSTSAARALEFEYFYEIPADPHLQQLYIRLSSQDPLAQLRTYLLPLRLYHKIVLKTKECGSGETTRAYAPGKDLVFCYEYLQRAEQLALHAKALDPTSHQDIRQTIVTGAFVHATLHLVAQEIFHQLRTPLWGNRNDAADRLASYAMVRLNPHKAAEWFVGASIYFARSGAEAPADLTSLRTPDSQRFYDHFCFAQAAGPATFAKLVGVAAERLFDGGEAEKIKKVFSALAMSDPQERMKEVEGLDPNDRIFGSRFYRRMRLCDQELEEVRSAFDREIRPHLAVESQQ